MPQGTPQRSNSDATPESKKFRPVSSTPSDVSRLKINLQYEQKASSTTCVSKNPTTHNIPSDNTKSLVTNCDVTKVTPTPKEVGRITSSLLSSLGTQGYVGIDTLQEQTRVKALRKGFSFNLMIAGRSGLGKSTLVNTLFQSEVSRRKPGIVEKLPSTTEIHSCSRMLCEGGVTLHLTITDTPGFGDQVNNENCWDPLINYIETQYDKYLQQELKVDRPRYVDDTRVHCCIYFIPPTGHELSSLDIEVLRRLEKVVNVVPVVAKSDTLTIEERVNFKSRIKSDLLEHGIRVYPVVDFEDEEDSVENSKLRARLPFCIVGSQTWHEEGGKKILARKCNWGTVEIENRHHSDFPYLRDMLIRTHMTDLISVTNFRHYEAYRRNKLNLISSEDLSNLTFSTAESPEETKSDIELSPLKIVEGDSDNDYAYY